MRIHRPILTAFVLAFASTAAHAAEPIESVLAHPPYDEYYTCGEHRQGELPYLGDNLGTDCTVHRLVTEDERTWARAYAGDGRSNEQWFGWNVPVLAPCECEVAKLHSNPVTNQPGELGTPPASMILLKRADGVHFLIAHVQDVSVQVGDKVGYGQPIARVGNNGYGRSPHLHVGAWKDKAALQIRWDTSVPASEDKRSD